jgi:hypothetical protein
MLVLDEKGNYFDEDDYLDDTQDVEDDDDYEEVTRGMNFAQLHLARCLVFESEGVLYKVDGDNPSEDNSPVLFRTYRVPTWQPETVYMQTLYMESDPSILDPSISMAVVEFDLQNLNVTKYSVTQLGGPGVIYQVNADQTGQKPVWSGYMLLGSSAKRLSTVPGDKTVKGGKLPPPPPLLLEIPIYWVVIFLLLRLPFGG